MNPSRLTIFRLFTPLAFAATLLLAACSSGSAPVTVPPPAKSNEPPRWEYMYIDVWDLFDGPLGYESDETCMTINPLCQDGIGHSRR